ncbi:MAG: DinB family protein [Taibaiella sp.]|nr:DinB family protein [Taibaiella sp.]
MENIQGKAEFLRNDYIKVLSGIDPAAKPVWGKMNVQQMIEHINDYVRISSGKDVQPVVTPPEHIDKYHAFLATEKPFKENTPNVLMADTPVAVKHADTKDAIIALQGEIDYLFEQLDNNRDIRTSHPFFGELNYEQTIQLLHKHATHHLRQFGIG